MERSFLTIVLIRTIVPILCRNIFIGNGIYYVMYHKNYISSYLLFVKLSS